MGKEVDYKNRDRFIQLGIAISTLRRIRGLSQEKLAEKSNISRSLLSNIEAPNMAYGFSLNVFYNIADALDITPEDLIKTSVFSDDIIGHKSNH
ncbi:MAG: helix-turn-helix transcriptional regulator [Clostridia bacterium]|nr:helix-turn-helix transcriptional regulator [Clostridia bacterium]